MQTRAPMFSGVIVSAGLKRKQPDQAAEIEKALQKPVNNAMVALLDNLNADEGGTDVVFFEEPSFSMGDVFLTDIQDESLPGEIRAKIVVGKGEKQRVLKDSFGPESRRQGNSWFSSQVGLADFVAQALAAAFKEGSFEQTRKAAAKK